MKKCVLSMFTAVMMVSVFTACNENTIITQQPIDSLEQDTERTTEQLLPETNQDNDVDDNDNDENPLRNPENIGDIIRFGEYDWRVLDIQEGKALIISEKLTEFRPYDNRLDRSFVSWHDSDLRMYLNGEFYNSFNDDDRERIIMTTNKNIDNQWMVTPCDTSDTDDYIFLLSLDEMLQYFGDSGELYADRLDEPIPVAEEMDGLIFMWWIDKEQRDSIFIEDEYSSARIAYDLDGEAHYWWLRSPAHWSYGGAVVTSDGYLDVIGWITGRGSAEGVRPALWLKLQEE